MPIQLNEENGGKQINMHVNGKLEKADYEHFVPEFERLARQHGKLRVLFDMAGFHGWEVSAANPGPCHSPGPYPPPKPRPQTKQSPQVHQGTRGLHACYQSSTNIMLRWRKVLQPLF